MENQLLILTFLVAKHFVGDFVLQANWMVSNKGRSIFALFTHCAVHVVLTAAVLYFLKFPTSSIAFAVLFEFWFHAVVDYLRASEQYFGSYSTSDYSYWVVLGFDQFLHYLSYLGMVVLLGRFV